MVEKTFREYLDSLESTLLHSKLDKLVDEILIRIEKMDIQTKEQALVFIEELHHDLYWGRRGHYQS